MITIFFSQTMSLVVYVIQNELLAVHDCDYESEHDNLGINNEGKNYNRSRV
jgi:hypothetical protein